MKYLPYAKPDLARWPGRRKLLVGVAILVAVLGAGWWQAPFLHSVWTNVKVVYLLHQCRAYNPGPDQIICTNDPGEVARLRTTPGFTVETREVAPPVALFSLPALTRLNDEIEPPGASVVDGATAFLHTLTTPSGKSALVWVRDIHQLAHSAGNDTFWLAATVYSPGHPWTEPADGSLEQGFIDYYPGSARVFAGQIDPADASRFSIRLTCGDKEDWVDGRLIDTPAGPTVWLASRTAETMSPTAMRTYIRSLQEYDPPPSQVVYDNDPVSTAKRFSTGNYHHPYWHEYDFSAAALKVPSIWQERYLHIQTQANHWGDGGGFEGPVLFLGRLTAGGVSRIVRVDLYGCFNQDSGRESPNSCYVTVLNDASPGQPVQVVGAVERSVTFVELTNPVRFYAGRRDPVDPARFTVEYDLGGTNGRLEGRLLPDGHTVRFRGWPGDDGHDLDVTAETKRDGE